MFFKADIDPSENGWIVPDAGSGHLSNHIGDHIRIWREWSELDCFSTVFVAVHLWLDHPSILGNKVIDAGTFHASRVKLIKVPGFGGETTSLSPPKCQKPKNYL